MTLTPTTEARVEGYDAMAQVAHIKQKSVKKAASMNQVQWLRIALVLLLALGLALPAVAQVRDPRLSNSQEPGSMIVFPKFIYNPGGTATQAASALVTGAPIPFISGPGELAFDGTAYQAVPGTIASSLRFEQLPPTSH
jgi:hypothetical protein